MPAKACPPVWWIVLDASQSSRLYWNAMGSLLEKILPTIPSHVHIGLVAASSKRLSSWKLSSSLPHVQHYALDSTISSPALPLTLVPCEGNYQTQLRAAIRAMADILVSKKENEQEGMDLTTTLQILLDFMEQAEHPGDTIDGVGTNNEDDANPQDNYDDDGLALRYAGGKILCLLSNPPLDIVPPTTTKNKDKIILGQESQPHYNEGGLGGACGSPQKWEGAPDDLPVAETTDLTPANLAEYVQPLEPETLWQDLGTRCASAAMSVDILVVMPEEDEQTGGAVKAKPSATVEDTDDDDDDDDDDEVTADDSGYDDDEEEDAEDDEEEDSVEEDDDDDDASTRPFFGLPLLKALVDASGAPGPLIFGTKGESFQALEREIMARAPWQRGMIFGATVRARVSPGFTIEDSPIDKVGRAKLQLAPFLSAGGWSGPGVHVDEGLWVMGTCDAKTSVVLDFQVEKEVKDVWTADGFGDVKCKPTMQTCIAYTSVEQDEKGNYNTVRKMKISSVSLPLVEDVEPLYDALDPEALAVVLFQKLLINALQEGLEAAYETAGLWLRALLVCVYQSAQVEQAKMEELMEEQGVKSIKKIKGKHAIFNGKNRLVDIDGDLDEDDIVLGQGHAKVAVLPLILYCLIQCDALRPTGGSFAPSLDARSAAMNQMASMMPSTLSKCIAPILQIWSIKEDKLLVPNVDLNRAAIKKALKKIDITDGIFFVDSPQALFACRTESYNMNKKKKSKVMDTEPRLLKVGPKLEAAMNIAARAYRAPPPRVIEGVGTAGKFVQQLLENTLVEDFKTASGTKGFAGWKEEVAEGVREELKKSGDITS